MTGSKTQKFTAVQSVELPVPNNPIPIQHYLRQPQRLVHTLVDPSRMDVLGADYFRLKMRPLNFLMLNIQPIVDLRVWVAADGVLKVRSVDCQIHGFEYANNRFELTLLGQLEPVTQAEFTLLRGRADLEVIVDLPPVLWFTPKPLLEATGTGLLKSILLTMQQRLSHQLLADYTAWVKDQLARDSARFSTDVIAEGSY